MLCHKLDRISCSCIVLALLLSGRLLNVTVCQAINDPALAAQVTAAAKKGKRPRHCLLPSPKKMGRRSWSC